MNLIAKIFTIAWTQRATPEMARRSPPHSPRINIFGAHFRGRAELTKRMQSIFGTIFKGSVHRSRNLEVARHLSKGVVLAVSSARVEVPSGPLAPEIRNRQPFILVQEDGEWRVRHWQNTPIRSVQWGTGLDPVCRAA